MTMTSAGSVVACYTMTQNIDEGLAMQRNGGNSYYEADGLGSITSLTSSTGSVANTYTYDSFGNLTNFAGTVHNPFLYTGREYDNETSLYFNRARYYNPQNGRLIGEDPIEFLGGANFYVYVSNNPSNLSDPLGLCGKKPATNGNWLWTFTKSFFAFAGGPGNVPTCTGQALYHIAEALNPFTPGVSTATEAVAPVAQGVAINQGIAQTQAGMDAYVAARGLTVPLRSSIVRTMAAEGAESAVAAGARANVAVQTLAVDYAAINSTITTAGEARNGQCAAALPIF